MATPRLVLYIASSLDAYIAGDDGSVDGLTPYTDATAGFGAFMGTVGASIMGRHTYEFVRQFAPTPKPDDPPTFVLTTRALEGAPPSVIACQGDTRAVLDQARTSLAARGGKGARDIWLVGGGQAVAAFHAAGLIDLYRIFLVPATLGRGIRLFPPGDPGVRGLRLTGTHTFGSGVVELSYEPARR